MSREVVIADLIRTDARQLKMPGLARAFETLARQWPRAFADDEKLTTALLDRLAERAKIITTRGKSYRMRRRATRESVSAPNEVPTPDTRTATPTRTRKE